MLTKTFYLPYTKNLLGFTHWGIYPCDAAPIQMVPISLRAEDFLSASMIKNFLDPTYKHWSFFFIPSEKSAMRNVSLSQEEEYIHNLMRFPKDAMEIFCQLLQLPQPTEIFTTNGTYRSTTLASAATAIAELTENYKHLGVRDVAYFRNVQISLKVLGYGINNP